MELDKAARGIERVANPLSRITDSVGRVILALMMLLITVDVVLRYFLNRPIKGSYELVEFMLVLLVYLGLAYTSYPKVKYRSSVVPRTFFVWPYLALYPGGVCFKRRP
jgi:TRAP-type C4-dicarboxylate transport system permease small subunit